MQTQVTLDDVDFRAIRGLICEAFDGCYSPQNIADACPYSSWNYCQDKLYTDCRRLAKKLALKMDWETVQQEPTKNCQVKISD